MALIVLLFHLSDIWPELPTERLLQNESHSVWRATGMWWHKKKQGGKKKTKKSRTAFNEADLMHPFSSHGNTGVCRLLLQPTNNPERFKTYDSHHRVAST